MATVRISLLFVVMSLFLSSVANAQKSPLLITGAIVDVTPDGPYKTPYVIKNNLLERQETHFAVKVRLQYYNRGDEAIIVPVPGSFFAGTKTLQFLEIPATESEISATSDEWMFPGRKGKDIVASYLPELSSSEPSHYYFAIIEPGGTFETGDTIRATTGYKLEVRQSHDKVKRDIEVAIPEHPYFKIKFSLSIKDRSESIEPLADAQRRWRRFGKLLLDSNGDYSQQSEFIINKQPN